MSSGDRRRRSLARHRVSSRTDRSGGPLLRVARLDAGWLTLLTLATVASTVITLLLPAFVATAVDAALRGHDAAAAVGRLAALLAGGLVATTAVQVAQAYCTADATAWLRRRLVRRLLDPGVAGRRRFAAGDVASRAISGAPQAAGIAPLVVNGAAGAVLSLGAAVALWLVDWRVVATLAPAVLVGLLLARRFARCATAQATRYQEVHGEIAARLVDALTGVRTIRAAGTVREEIDRVLAPLPGLSAAGHALWRSHGQMAGRASLLVPLAGLGALAVAGHGVVTGRVSPGQLLAVAGYAPMALGLLNQTGLLMNLARLRAGAARLDEVLTEPVPRGGSRAVPPGPGELVLRDITVRAAGVTLLDGVTLSVPPGSMTAVVGRSGAGKSTLAAVAGRLVDPDGGWVMLDGVPLDEIESQQLRREITYAFDQPRLLGATVADAIGYGHDAIDREQVEHAATVARADHFIRRLPQGFDTPLECAPMSDGERQRLGLARAFSRAGRLLILDDATSSLDTVTEAQVGAALAEAMPGRTRLVVAHRVRTAERADLVAWLDAGRIRALAPHRDLWAQPEYRAMFTSDGPVRASGAVPAGEPR